MELSVLVNGRDVIGWTCEERRRWGLLWWDVTLVWLNPRITKNKYCTDLMERMLSLVRRAGRK